MDKTAAADGNFSKAGTYYIPEIAEELSRIVKRQIDQSKIVDEIYWIWNRNKGVWAFVRSSDRTTYYRTTLEACSCPGWRGHHANKDASFFCRHQRLLAEELSKEDVKSLASWQLDSVVQARDKLRADKFATPEKTEEIEEIDLASQVPEVRLARLQAEDKEINLRICRLVDDKERARKQHVNKPNRANRYQLSQREAELKTAIGKSNKLRKEISDLDPNKHVSKLAKSKAIDPGLSAFREGVKEDQDRVAKAQTLHNKSIFEKGKLAIPPED